MGPTPVSFSTVFKESYRSIDLAFQLSKSVVGEELDLSHNSQYRPPPFGEQWCPTLQASAPHSNSFFVPSLEVSQNLNRLLGNAKMTVRSLCISVEIQRGEVSFSLSGDSEIASNAFFIRIYGVALSSLWDMHSWLCSKTNVVPFPLWFHHVPRGAKWGPKLSFPSGMVPPYYLCRPMLTIGNHDSVHPI